MFTNPLNIKNGKSKLKFLDLSINQFSNIENLQQMINIEELNLRQNKIDVIEGLSQLQKLRKLNLSFNRITKLEGIQNLKLLEVLELGKNYISDVDALVSTVNPLIHLQELYLYMNELRRLPENLCFP